MHSYRSVGELAADSDLVVCGIATADRVVDQGAGVPCTVTVISVSRTLAGLAPGDTVVVRQVGSPGELPELEPGRPYVLFLQRFRSAPDRPDGQYVVTGNRAGLYAEQGPTLWRLDPALVDLPDRLHLADLSWQLASA
jgi:hypothetical protein